MTDETLQKIAGFFIESRDWNGMPARQLPELKRADPSWLVKCIEEELVDIQDARAVLNPHNRRIRLSPAEQLRCLEYYQPEQTCIYPSERLLRLCGHADKIDTAPPYEKELMIGCAQLEFRYFNLPVIDRYIQDPRYIIFWGSTQGSISIRNEYINDDTLPASAKCVIESFGLGLDSLGNRVTCSFLRYLARLTQDQQMYWKSYEHPQEASPVEPYFRSAILGEFPATISVIRAILREMEIINYLLNRHGHEILFKAVPEKESLPHYLTSFIKPTQYEFDTFAAALEQATLAQVNNDAISAYKLDSNFGTVHGFKQMVRHYVSRHFDEETENQCIDAIQDLMNARQGVSHKIGANNFGKHHDKARRSINEKIYKCFRALRESLETHYEDRVSDPFLDDWKIHNY